MMSQDFKDYASPADWLAAVKQSGAWLSQLEQLTSAQPADYEYFTKEAMQRISTNSEVYEYWKIHQHRIVPTIEEVWGGPGISPSKLKIYVIGMLTMEWFGEFNQQKARTSAEESDKPNLYAPKRHLQELLKQPWFAEVRKDSKYDAKWTDDFIEALMASEYGEAIARDWELTGAKNKKKQLKGYVVGLLKDADVLPCKMSYDKIAEKVNITENPRTFSHYMGDGKKQPYEEWVKAYVTRNEKRPK